MDGKSLTFNELDDALVRAFREYAIPTIEIDLDDESTSIDEIVNLFIDINQQGVKVSRFDVVKALGRDPLFKQVFDLIAVKETRKKKSTYYNAKSGNFVFVMKRLNIVQRLADKNSRVDRMWERLTEIALFSRTDEHRAPSQILKALIKAGDQTNERLTKKELAKLRDAFDFLASAYRKAPELMKTKFATDQPQFYTLITSLLRTDLMDEFDANEFARRLNVVSRLIDGSVKPSGYQKNLIQEYHDLSTKQTTNPSRRQRREEILIQLIKSSR